MKVRIKKDSNNVWSFVEVWNSKYKYKSKGTIKALISIKMTKDSYSCNPLQLKGTVFQPLLNILNTYSIFDWLLAKKPIYSEIDGIFVRFIVKYDLNTLEPDFENSSFELYQPIFDMATEEYLPLTRVMFVSTELTERLNVIMRELFGDEVNRGTFLERRMAIESVNS